MDLNREEFLKLKKDFIPTWYVATIRSFYPRLPQNVGYLERFKT